MELIEAASKGDQRSLDQFDDELFTNSDCAEGDQSLYSVAAGEVQEFAELVFCFGKAVGSEIGTNVVLIKPFSFAFTFEYVHCVSVRSFTVCKNLTI